MNALEQAKAVGYSAGLTDHELKVTIISHRENTGHIITAAVSDSEANSWLAEAHQHNPKEFKSMVEAYSKYLFQVFSF